jgi:hypothetical protein
MTLHGELRAQGGIRRIGDLAPGLRRLEALLGATALALALDDQPLDRIDEIVAPGSDHYRITWRPPELDDPTTRRRPLTDRAAA